MNFARRIPFPVQPTLATFAILQLAFLVAALASALPVHAADTQAVHSFRAIKERVAPRYPEIARWLHVAGIVKIEATVNADGTVASTRTIDGNRMLSGAAEDAVHLWKFVPAAESSTVEVEVNFAQGH